MTVNVKNLKRVMERFGLTNKALAEAMGVDPSYASRIIAGKRSLTAASRLMDAMTELVLRSATKVSDIEWLKECFRRDGLPASAPTAYQLKQNLTKWLACEEPEPKRNPTGGDPPAPKPAHVPERGKVIVGSRDLALDLEPLIEGLGEGGRADIFLSSDRIATLTDGDFSRLLLHAVETRGLAVRMVVCVSGNTDSMSTLIHTYMQALLSGRMRLKVLHGLTATITHQMHMVLGDEAVVLVAETFAGAAPPVATIVREGTFVAQTGRVFEDAERYAQPVLTVYDDGCTRGILEILHSEFAMPGDLDVVKDSIKPHVHDPGGVRPVSLDDVAGRI